MLNARNYELNSETEIGQKGRTFYFEKKNYVQNGIRQQNA
jgi:hypothetical protein